MNGAEVCCACRMCDGQKVYKEVFGGENLTKGNKLKDLVVYTVKRVLKEYNVRL
jgi:hypothetical protein